MDAIAKAKEQAGEAALKHISSGMNVGLGTGSTTDYFLIALGREVRAGQLTGIRGVPTSIRSENRAKELGIPVCNLSDVPYLDVAVDGADEVDPKLQLVKGLGGALLREKIIAQAAKKFVVIADGGKKVPRLGTRSPLPVEVTTFAHDAHGLFWKSLGCDPILRKTPDGKTYVTDNGNYIYDCRFPTGIEDPTATEMKLLKHAGIVDTGLFLNIASVVLIASESGVEELTR
jgi:ribose 5-phosphate isomerase A